MFQKNWKGILNILKNTQNQPKKGHAGKVRIQRFSRKLKSPQNTPFFSSNWLFSWENKILKVSARIEKGIFSISKNTQNQPKNGHAGKVRIQRFCRILKSPQNMLFFLQSDCFHERTKFWRFLENWKGIFNISKNTQNQPKNATPVRSGYSNFAENWEVPKKCFSLFKAIVFIKEQNFECFRRIGRVFSTFQKILKINQKMPRR